MKKKMFEELKQSLREASLIKRGQLKPGRVVRVNPSSNIVRLRGKLGLSQSKHDVIKNCRCQIIAHKRRSVALGRAQSANRGSSANTTSLRV